MKIRKGKFQYIQLADRIQEQIENGSYTLTEKLPSLRVLCRNTGLSMTTVFQAYIELEKRGIVQARHRSGYFIQPRIGKLRPVPRMTDQADVVPRKVSLDDMIHQLTEDMGRPDVLKLGGVTVAPEHLPARSLHRQLKSVPKNVIPDLFGGYAPPKGDRGLREQLTHLLFPIIPFVRPDDIVITNGCTEALSLSLRAVAKPGDTIVMESPADPWLRQTIKDFEMYALEIPADPETGIDLVLLEKAVHSQTVSACIINSNCHNPLGYVMPDERKKELLALMKRKQIPIIENDVTAELYFGEKRPNPVKKWDDWDGVFYCSSFTKVLAAGLRVGWVVVPQKYKQTIIRMKLNRSLISPTLNQRLVAGYLKEGGYNRHLRRLRKTIRLQYSYCAAAIHRYFPENVRMTAPKGGLCIWIELPPKIQGQAVYQQAIAKGISILPGFLCTSLNTFDHYIRLGFGIKWNKSVEKAICEVGRIVKRFA